MNDLSVMWEKIGGYSARLDNLEDQMKEIAHALKDIKENMGLFPQLAKHISEVGSKWEEVATRFEKLEEQFSKDTVFVRDIRLLKDRGVKTFTIMGILFVTLGFLTNEGVRFLIATFEKAKAIIMITKGG